MDTETVETTDVKTETVETQATKPEQQEEAFDQARAMETIRKLREIERQAKKDRAELDRVKADEQKRKDAELSEAERLKKENETLRAQAEAANRAVLQRDIAAEVGLPATFAAKIQGADHDAMLADAKAMLEAFPKTKPAPGSATNPGGATKGETDEEKRKRLGLR